MIFRAWWRMPSAAKDRKTPHGELVEQYGDAAAVRRALKFDLLDFVQVVWNSLFRRLAIRLDRSTARRNLTAYLMMARNRVAWKFGVVS